MAKKFIRPIYEFCTDRHKDIITIEMAKKRFSQQVKDLIVYVEGTENAQKYLDEKLESTNPVIEDGVNIASLDSSDDEIEATADHE